MVDKYKTPSFYILSAMIGFGLGLAAVGMFTGAASVVSDLPDVSGTISLFDEDFSTLGISNAFTIISFIVTIIGALILTAEISLRVKQHKYIRALHIAGIAVTAVGAILVLVSGMILAKDIKDGLIEFALAMSGGSAAEGAMLDQLVTVNAGVGIWLGFIGGLVSAIASGVSMLKRFMPDPPAPQAQEPVAANVAPATEQAAPAQNDNAEPPVQNTTDVNNDLL